MINKRLLEIGIAGALIAGSLGGCTMTRSSAGINVFGEDIVKGIVYSGTPQPEKYKDDLNNNGIGLYYRVRIK